MQYVMVGLGASLPADELMLRRAAFLADVSMVCMYVVRGGIDLQVYSEISGRDVVFRRRS